MKPARTILIIASFLFLAINMSIEAQQVEKTESSGKDTADEIAKIQLRLDKLAAEQKQLSDSLERIEKSLSEKLDRLSKEKIDSNTLQNNLIA